MTLKLSQRGRVAPFQVMEIVAQSNALLAQGTSVIRCEVGQPSTSAPSPALLAAQRALDSGDALGYTDSDGLPSLRQGIADLYRSRYDQGVTASEVVVTAGASAACLLSFLAVFEVGDRVGVCEPGYPCYEQMLSSIGCIPVRIPCGVEAHFRCTPDALEAVGGLAGLVIASPSNPTGTIMDAASLTAIVQWCHHNDVWLISDEIYHGITSAKSCHSVREFTEEAIVIGSFSKYFSMTGWRVGWTVSRPDVAEQITHLAANLFLAPNTIAQHAAIGALTPTAISECEEHVRRYDVNRQLLSTALREVGFTTLAPHDGAFYVYANIDPSGCASNDLATTWLHEFGLAAAPGTDFDQADGSHWMRFSVAGSTERILSACEILRHWSLRST